MKPTDGVRRERGTLLLHPLYANDGNTDRSGPFNPSGQSAAGAQPFVSRHARSDETIVPIRSVPA